MSQKAFAFVGTRCTGCKTCSAACIDYNDLNGHIAYRKIYEYGGGRCTINDSGKIEDSTYVYYIPMACNHCDDAICATVCPTRAMTKDEETGLVYVNSDKCIGCGYCAMACPYGSPMVDEEKGRAVKCDGCISRVKDGKAPICVEACPMRALQFDDAEKIASEYGDLKSIPPLPDENVTKPNCVYVAPNKAELPEAKTGSILNREEV